MLLVEEYRFDNIFDEIWRLKDVWKIMEMEDERIIEIIERDSNFNC